ncbi:MAG: sensor histidine kinase [Bacteroidetes bacterium]|nr:sensor histidine kinase [Bacteroidota bacterium]
MSGQINTNRKDESVGQFRDLSAYLQAAREEERKRIAREIHDELGQALTAIKIELSLLREEVIHDATAATHRINYLKDRVDETIHAVKNIITKLRPGLLDDLGLSAAIEWQAKDFQQHTGIVCDVHCEPEEILINSEISTAVFRIFQETLTNITRHSKATRVKADLTKTENMLTLQVVDNGRGITREEINDSKSFGLIGIRERAQYWHGTVQIAGETGSGTKIIVQFPMPPEGLQ